MQGIGFTDKISHAELDSITEAVREGLRLLSPLKVTFHKPAVRREAVYLRAVPKEPVYELRRTVYKAVVSVLGSDRLPKAPPTQQVIFPGKPVTYQEDRRRNRDPGHDAPDPSFSQAGFPDSGRCPYRHRISFTA